LDDWKKRRGLKQELKKIDAEFEPQFKAAGDNEAERSEVMAKYEAQIQGPWEELRWSETVRLRIKAFRFGIELPPGDDDDSWEPAHFWETVSKGYKAAQESWS